MKQYNQLIATYPTDDIDKIYDQSKRFVIFLTGLSYWPTDIIQNEGGPASMVDRAVCYCLEYYPPIENITKGLRSYRADLDKYYGPNQTENRIQRYGIPDFRIQNAQSLFSSEFPSAPSEEHSLIYETYHYLNLSELERDVIDTLASTNSRAETATMLGITDLDIWNIVKKVRRHLRYTLAGKENWIDQPNHVISSHKRWHESRGLAAPDCPLCAA
jgi:hypothetical protein